MAYIAASQINTNNVTCFLKALDTSYSYNDRSIKWYYDSVYKGTSYLNAYVASGGHFNATGLNPNTQYAVEAWVYKNSTLIVALSGYVTTAWDWYSPRVAGGNVNLTPNEWIDFCNKINDVRKFYKDNNLKNLDPYPFTQDPNLIAKDKNFYAYIFLQAANAINEINGQVNSACLNVKSWFVSQGNDSIIQPWYFDNLKAALNNAMNSALSQIP
ncbi:MAG: hypothetical protein PHC75_10375 [Burkholderiales bacterium]|nr:hypothetical protein [Burkholderiales bacterium]